MSRITGPLFKWFGSKWLSAKTLPIPICDTIIEPFAGGAGYSLRYFDKKVILAEKNPMVKRLWEWLIQEANESDIRDIPLDLKEGTDIRFIGLSEGQALLLKHWQRTNNVGDCWTISPWGNKPGQWTANTRARVAEEFQAIRHWAILSDGMRLMYQESIADSTTWFIDPLYQYNYQYGMPAHDYRMLGKTIERLRGQVIVCEAICPKSGDIPTWLPFSAFGERITSRRKEGNNHHSKELIYHARQYLGGKRDML